MFDANAAFDLHAGHEAAARHGAAQLAALEAPTALALPPGVSTEAAALFLGAPHRRRVQAHQALFLAGQPCRSLFLVHGGFFKTRVSSNDGREKVTGRRMRGDLVGLESFGQAQYACDAIALDLGEVWEIPMARACSDAAAQAFLAGQLAGQVRRDWQWMLDAGTLTAEQRVVGFLLDLSARHAALGFSATRLDVRMTRSEIGSYLSLQLETVTRALSHLQALGLVAVDRRHVTLRDVDALRARLALH
jgi:CRP/FNR family transcriptional regulator